MPRASRVEHPDQARREPRDPLQDQLSPWRQRLHRIIFAADTPAGKWFDIALLIAISLNVLAVMLESMAEVRSRFGEELIALEWAFTGLFCVEYVLRLISVARPSHYARSFFGLVDLMALLPAFLGLFFSGTHSLGIIRSLRLLRVFRILKLFQFVGAGNVLVQALINSRRKITVFVGSVLAMAGIMGSIMYLIEGPEHGFTSIPRGIYWAVVTMTTVGYGDIHPQTAFGQAVALVVMILGYGVLAVPTGIVSAELVDAKRHGDNRSCPRCSAEGHDGAALHCSQCGAQLPMES